MNKKQFKRLLFDNAGELIMLLFLMILAIYCLVESYKFKEAAQLLPMLVSRFLIIIIFVRLILMIIGNKKIFKTSPTQNYYSLKTIKVQVNKNKPVIKYISFMILYVVLVRIIGFGISTIILITLILCTSSEGIKGIRIQGIIIIYLISLLLLFIFNYSLRVPLF